MRKYKFSVISPDGKRENVYTLADSFSNAWMNLVGTFAMKDNGIIESGDFVKGWTVEVLGIE